jgi:hypothetical protein
MYLHRSTPEYDRQKVPVLGSISEYEVERATVKPSSKKHIT